MVQDVAMDLKIPTKDDLLLSEIVRRNAVAYCPEKIYLFGSVARGDADADSDYELIVLVPDDAPESLRSSDPAYRAVADLDRSGDFLVWTHGAFEKRLHIPSSLPAAVLREGVVLYAAE